MTRNIALIIDDDTGLGELLGIVLEGKGLSIDIRNDYNTNLTQEESNKLYVAFLDYNCPPCNGNGWIEQNGMYVPDSRRVLMSADNGWQQSGIDGYLLSKPFRIKQIDDILDKIAGETK